MSQTKQKTRADIDVYTTFIDSLFAGRKQILLGAVLQLVITVILWVTTGAQALGWLAMFIVLVAIFRHIQAGAYQKEAAARLYSFDDDHYRWAKKWEHKAITACGLAGLTVGLTVFVSLHVAVDQLVTVAAMVLLFAGFPTVVGRLYGSIALSTTMMATMLIPASLGLIFRPDTLHLALALLAIPYGWMIVGIVKEVRTPVEQAVRRRNAIEVMANEFDKAVNSMPNGLIMLDDDRRIIVANDPVRCLLKLTPETRVRGRTIDVLIRHSSRRGVIDSSGIKSLQSMLHSISDGKRARGKITLLDGRVLEFSRRLENNDKPVIIIEDITKRIESLEKIKYLARFDVLTSLPNRTYFTSLAEKALDKSVEQYVTLIVFDIDDFKHINDSIGHHQGDLLLSGIASKLSDYRDAGWIAGRQGGDEFLLFKTGACDSIEVERFAKGLSEHLSTAYTLDQEIVRVTVSLGAYHCPVDGFDLGRGLRRADIALYESKRNGKAGYSLFTPDMEQTYRSRQMLKADLLAALEHSELTVLYQPIIGCESQKIYSAEALCRWSRQGKMVSPAVFIPLAEEMGVVSRITEFVVDRACADVATWQNGAKVSVNLSAIDFHSLDIASVIAAACQRHCVDPMRVDVEITETAVIRNRMRMETQINAIRALGCSVSLDDFGTGHSSLSYLDSLPLDTVKLDRTFVEGIVGDKKRMDLLSSVVSLCHTLGKQVVVEGVESVDQLQLIRDEVRADRVQGWVYAPALPSSAIARFTTVKADADLMKVVNE